MPWCSNFFFLNFNKFLNFMTASKIIFYDWKARSKSLAEFFLFSLSFRIFSFSGFCSFLVLSFRQRAAVGRCCQADAAVRLLPALPVLPKLPPPPVQGRESFGGWLLFKVYSIGSRPPTDVRNVKMVELKAGQTRRASETRVSKTRSVQIS